MGVVIRQKYPEVSCWPLLFVATILCVMLARPFRIVCEVESTRAIALMILETFGFGFAGASLALARDPRCRVLFLFFDCHLLFLLVLLLATLVASLLYSVAF
jgi:hypothetical protein